MRGLPTIVLCALVGLGIHEGGVHAQAAAAAGAGLDARREHAAQVEFERGSELYAARALPAAIEAFTTSYSLVPTANVAFNIAQTCELLGRTEDAFNWYQASARLSGTGAGGPARDRIATLSPRVAVLSVEIRPAAALLTIDGAEQAAVSVASIPQLLAVSPGPHRVSARHPGYASADASVEGVRGRIVPVALILTPWPGTLSVESVPDGAAVLLRPEMRMLGTTPLTVELAPGPVGLALRRAGYVDYEVDALVRPNAVTLVSLPLAPTPERQTPANRTTADIARPAPRDDLAPTVRGLGDWRWVGYGAAAVLLGVGGTFGVLAIDKHAQVEADPERAGQSDLTRLNLAADVSAIGALLTAAVTLTLDLTLTRVPEKRTKARAEARARAELGPRARTAHSLHEICESKGPATAGVTLFTQRSPGETNRETP